MAQSKCNKCGWHQMLSTNYDGQNEIIERVCYDEDACKARRIRAALKKAKEEQYLGGTIGSQNFKLTDRFTASEKGRKRMHRQY